MTLIARFHRVFLLLLLLTACTNSQATQNISADSCPITEPVWIKPPKMLPSQIHRHSGITLQTKIVPYWHPPGGQIRKIINYMWLKKVSKWDGFDQREHH